MDGNVLALNHQAPPITVFSPTPNFLYLTPYSSLSTSCFPSPLAGLRAASARAIYRVRFLLQGN